MLQLILTIQAGCGISIVRVTGMNKNFAPIILFRCSTLLLMLSLALTGCAVMQVREEVNTLQVSTVLVGIVSTLLPH